jgi:hypothetical protein
MFESDTFLEHFTATTYTSRGGILIIKVIIALFFVPLQRVSTVFKRGRTKKRVGYLIEGIVSQLALIWRSLILPTN